MARTFFAIGKANKYYVNGRHSPEPHRFRTGSMTQKVKTVTKDGPAEVKVTSVLHRPLFFERQIEQQRRKQERGFFGKIADKMRSMMDRGKVT